MKSTVKWLIFVPVCLASTLLMLFVGLSSGGNQAGSGISMNTAAEIVITSFLCMYLLFAVLSIFDKQTARVHLLLKNIFCTITAALSAFALSATAALEVTSMARNASFGLLGVITSLLTLLSAAALLFIAMNHLTGSNSSGNISILYLALPLWCGVHLISRFLAHTADPVSASETLDLVMYVALALFFIYSMMVHSLIPGKNAVKSSISVGFPTVMICFVYAVAELIKVLSSQTKSISTFLPVISALFLGLYVLGFTVELSLKSKNVDELQLEDEALPEEEEVYEEELSEEAEASFEEEEAEEVVEYYENLTQDLSFSENTENSNEYSGFFEDDNNPEKKSASKDYDDSDTRSEENVIVEGENVTPAVQKVPLEKGGRGATVKESIMIDDDFILSIDPSDDRKEKPVYDKDEDISSFILGEPSEVKTPDVADDSKYESRMDEIDRLIISIQGGDDSEDKK